MKRIAAMLLLLVVTAVCRADPVVRIEQQQCKIEWGRQVCVIAGWSGTIIGPTNDRKGIVILSCAHGYERKPVTVTISDAIGPKPGTIVALDPAQKLCLIRVEHAASVEMLPLAEADVASGRRVGVIGYGNMLRQYREWQTDTKGFETVCDLPLGPQYRMLRVDATFRQGDSGGAIVADSQLVGVIESNPWQHAGDGWATPVSQQRAFVQAKLGYVPATLPTAGDSRGQEAGDRSQKDRADPCPLPPASSPAARSPQPVALPVPEPEDSTRAGPGTEGNGRAEFDQDALHAKVQEVVRDEVRKLALDQLPEIRESVKSGLAENTAGLSGLPDVVRNAAATAAGGAVSDLKGDLIGAVAGKLGATAGGGLLTTILGFGGAGLLGGGIPGIAVWLGLRGIKKIVAAKAAERRQETGDRGQKDRADPCLLSPVSSAAACSPEPVAPPAGMKTFPVVVQSPPPPQVVGTETFFQTIEKDSFSEAYAWAKGKLALMFPNQAESMLGTLDSLMSQYRKKT